MPLNRHSLRFSVVILTLSAVMLPVNAKAQDLEPAEALMPQHAEQQAAPLQSSLIYSVLDSSESADNTVTLDAELPGPDKPGRIRQVGRFLKGEKARSALYLGMWSEHIGTDKDYQEDNRLLALQHKGLYVGTFRNSHSDQTYIAGVARTVAKKTIGKNLELDAGYKVGPMYGYRRGVPAVGRLSALPFVTMGVSYKKLGVDFNYVPFTNVASINTRVNLTANPFQHRAWFKRKNADLSSLPEDVHDSVQAVE
jgi:hypothetical protein